MKWNSVMSGVGGEDKSSKASDDEDYHRNQE